MRPFSRRHLLALAIAALAGPSLAAGAPAAPTLSPEGEAAVTRVVSYLEGMGTVKGRFTQTDARGGSTEGAFYLQRPGRARFDYDPPSGLSIATDGHRVRVLDRRLKTFESYPLGLTPLGLFLAGHIRLDRGVVVTQADREGDRLAIVARSSDAKAKGQIRLAFSTGPLALTGWALTDARGATVTVRLQSLSRAEPRDDAFYDLPDPRPRALEGN